MASTVPALAPLPSFVELEWQEAHRHWSLKASRSLCVGPPAARALFGGVGLAAAVAALERTLEKPAIWVSAQFLEMAPEESMLIVEAEALVAGRHTMQARAVVREDERVILVASGALGARPGGEVRQWAQAPEAVPPEECGPLKIYWPRAENDMHSRLDVRVASGWGRDPSEPADRATFWIRPREPVAIDRVFLAVVGDFMPAALGAAVGQPLMSSLDNNIRFFDLAPTQWVLCDLRLYGARGGFGHGRLHMYAVDGTLLAMASQSVILRNTPRRSDR